MAIGFMGPLFLVSLFYMDLEKYVEELLYRYNCVVVPEFGAFLAQMKSAVIQADNHSFLPPRKSISFNQQLTSNDGLLASYVSQAENISYEEGLKQIREAAEKWMFRLQEKETLELGQIGEISMNTNGKLRFAPFQKVNFATSSFGLTQVVASPVAREVLREEVVALEEKTPLIFTPESKRSGSGARAYLKYAAVLLLALATGATAYHYTQLAPAELEIVRQEAQETVDRSIQEATFFDTTPVEMPVVELPVTKEAPIKYFKIIAGAYRIEANAESRIAELSQKGYKAVYLGQNKYGLHMVAYDSFDDPKEALNFLRTVKKTESPDAWIFQE